MYLNPDCCRDILLFAEAKPLGKSITIKKLSLQLPAYSDEELYYACLKLHEAGFLDVSLVGTIHGSLLPRINTINELTYAGHEFLENIRLPTTWEKTKTIASSIHSSDVSRGCYLTVNVAGDNL